MKIPPGHLHQLTVTEIASKLVEELAENDPKKRSLPSWWKLIDKPTFSKVQMGAELTWDGMVHPQLQAIWSRFDRLEKVLIVYQLEQQCRLINSQGQNPEMRGMANGQN